VDLSTAFFGSFLTNAPPGIDSFEEIPAAQFPRKLPLWARTLPKDRWFEPPDMELQSAQIRM